MTMRKVIDVATIVVRVVRRLRLVLVLVLLLLLLLLLHQCLSAHVKYYECLPGVPSCGTQPVKAAPSPGLVGRAWPVKDRVEAHARATEHE